MKKATLLFLILVFAVLAYATPAGWTYLGNYNSHTYYRSNDPVAATGIDAAVTAFRTSAGLSTGGAYAVAVDGAGENTALQTMLLAYNATKWASPKAPAGAYSDLRNVYIGYTDRVTEGTFAWMNGQTTTYTNWNPGEPNNSGAGEDYVEMLLMDAAGTGNPLGKWNDFQNTPLSLVVEVQSAGIALAVVTPPVIEAKKLEGGIALELSQRGEVFASRDGATFFSLGMHEGRFVDQRPAAHNYYRLVSDGVSSRIYRADYPFTAYLVYNRLGQLIARTATLTAYAQNPLYIVLSE